MNNTHFISMRGNMQDGSRIVIEDWRGVYPNLPEPFTVVAYPISQYNMPGQFSPKAGKTFRCGFTFPTMKAAETVFSAIVNGVPLKSYAEYMERKEYAPCIGGYEEAKRYLFSANMEG